MTELVPRPQRYGTWLCGGAALRPTVMRAARGGVLRPCAAAALAFLVCPTRTGRQTRRPGGSLGCLATRAGASWSTLAKRNPTRSGRRNTARPNEPEAAQPRMHLGQTNPSDVGHELGISRRTNPRQCNPTSIGLAKRTQRCVNLATPSLPNEPKPRTAAATRPFWPTEPKPKQTVSVVAKWTRRDATAQMLS